MGDRSHQATLDEKGALNWLARALKQLAAVELDTF
jgi:hypothetical protein